MWYHLHSGHGEQHEKVSSSYHPNNEGVHHADRNHHECEFLHLDGFHNDHPDHRCNSYHVDHLSDQHDIYHYVKGEIDHDPNVFEE